MLPGSPHRSSLRKDTETAETPRGSIVLQARTTCLLSSLPSVVISTCDVRTAAGRPDTRPQEERSYDDAEDPDGKRGYGK